FSLLSVLLLLVVVGCDSGADDTGACPGGVCPEDEYGFIDQGEQPPVDQPPVEEQPPAEVGFDLPFTVYPPADLEQVNLGGVIAPVSQDDLTAQEQARVDVLREAIGLGLELGRTHYLEEMTLALSGLGIVEDYEGMAQEGDDALSQVPEDCPFVKFYDNGFEPTGLTCDYLADMAKVEVYSELTQLLDDYALPADVENSPFVLADEAKFWYEQGAISGIEEHRVLVRSDLKARGLCSKNPTPVESSYDKGILVGRQLFAAEFNTWLQGHGYVADYPTMSQKITVCNVDMTMLQPSRAAALKAVDSTVQAQPLCEGDYSPMDQEAQLQFAQANIDYAEGIEWGVQDEFVLAGVRVFQVVPCNVGDPIVVDLDGDGLELLPIHQGVDFDLWADGRGQAVAWVHPDDGLLVRDVDANGRIDDGLELFGNVDGTHADGFAQLATLDADGDGALTPADAAFTSLRIWQDRNSDGRSDAGELVSLDRIGLERIPLQAHAQELTVAGNRIPFGVVATGPGVQRACGDAFLQAATHPRLTAAR
ncbi:MAG: hypothetical protein FJ098_04875, partial [Deltaproteobacteria bacterium]|nr:hypothetical protein [Deltaproteobacteria bacterium]